MRAIVAGLVVGLALLTAVELADLLVHVDNAVLDALVAHRTARWTALATAVTNTGASPFTYPLVAAAGLVVARRTRRWRPGVVALGVVCARRAVPGCCCPCSSRRRPAEPGAVAGPGRRLAASPPGMRRPACCWRGA